MANAKVLEFVRKAEQDQRLAAAVRAVKLDDREQALKALVRIAQRAGYELSQHELEAGLKDCAPRELSDAELDAAAGGTQYNETDLAFVSRRASPFVGFYIELTD